MKHQRVTSNFPTARGDPENRTAALADTRSGGKNSAFLSKVCPARIAESSNPATKIAREAELEDSLLRLARLRLFKHSDHTAWVDLVGQGVDYDRVLDLDIQVLRFLATFYEGREFDFDDNGETAFGFAITGEDAETEIDLCAWPIRRPDDFATLMRKAPIIGASNIVNPASFMRGPCPLYRTPLRWLQEGCQGAVIIDTYRASLITARAPGRLLAEDLDHARALVRAGAVRRDRILIRKGAVAA